MGFYLKNCKVFQPVLKVFSGANAHAVIALSLQFVGKNEFLSRKI